MSIDIAEILWDDEKDRWRTLWEAVAAYERAVAREELSRVCEIIEQEGQT